MELADFYRDTEREFGKPLVIYPADFQNDNMIEVGGDALESYWVVMDGGRKSGRTIVWLVGGFKAISESAGPAAHNCPLFLFDLVPTVTDLIWRDSVKKYWALQSVDEEYREHYAKAFHVGDSANSCGHALSKNPHAEGTELRKWWAKGWNFGAKHYPFSK